MSLIGCDYDNIYSSEFEPVTVDEFFENDDEYYIELVSYLEEDENGYYRMEFLEGYMQTFTTLTAKTGSYNQYQNVAWISNKEINIHGEWINLVNQSSYTDGDGEAHTVLGVWEEFIGDTVKVYSGYTDEYNVHYVDSMNVIID
jgi:hypothetical protein